MTGRPGTQARARQCLARLQQQVEAVRRLGQVDLAAAPAAVLVPDEDLEAADRDDVVLQFLDQPLDVARQPGVQPVGVGRRLAEAAAARQHLVRRPVGVQRLHRVAVQLPPEGFAGDGQQLA